MQRPAVDFPFHSDVGCPLGRIYWSGPYADSPGQPVRAQDQLVICYVTRGKCDYQDENGKRRLTAGDMMVLVPGRARGYRAPPGETWDEHYVSCDGPLIDLWQREGLVGGDDFIWRLLPVDYWVERMIAVIGDIIAPNPDESLAQLGRLQILLADMRQARRSPSAFNDDQVWLRQARRLLEVAQAKARPELEAVAEQMGCGYHTFRRRFALLAGVSPAQYRLQSQVSLAKALIMQSPATGNKQLALRCGFADEYHFSKQFKRIANMSPRDFRLMCQSSRGASGSVDA